jgi:hypothetical protein
MAAKKKSKKSTKEKKLNLGREHIMKLWTVRPARQWLNLLKDIAPENKWTMQGENTIKGCCPYKPENTPSFFLSFNMGMGKCFGCQKVTDDLVSVVAKAKRCSYMEALLFIQQYMHLEEEFSKYSEEIAYHFRVQEVKKQAAIVFRKILNQVITEDPPELSYLKPAIAYLTQGRGISLSALTTTSNLPVGLFAKPEHLKPHFTDDYFNQYMEYFGEKYQKPEYWGSLIFHYNDSPTLISRFKLQLLDKVAIEDAQKTDPSFNEISKEQARKLIRKDNSIFIDDPFSKNVGVLGLFNYQHLLATASDPNVYITEGEFDVLSVMNAQIKHDSYDFIILGTSGTGSLDVGFLRDYGVRTVWLIPDHPSKNGDVYARNFLAEKGNFVKVGASVPFSVKVFQWPKTVFGFDLDDALTAHDYDFIRDILITNRNSTFMNSNLWIRHKCDEAISIIKRERDQKINALSSDDESADLHVAIQNIQDDSRKMIHEKILEWFKFLHESTERLAFAQKYAVQEDIDITQDDRIHSDVYALDTWEGIIKKVTDSFCEYFNVAYYEKTVSEYRMNLWSRLRKELVTIPDSEHKLQKVLSIFFNERPILWLGKLLQGSSTWELDIDNPHKLHQEHKGITNNVIAEVLRGLYGASPNKQSLKVVGQGVHHFGLPYHLRNDEVMYFVNGNKVFKGTKNTKSEMLEWEYIDNCIDSNLLFTLSPSDDWSFVTDVPDLYSAAKVDLNKVFNKIKTILNGWYFDNHEVTVDYLASQIMSFPIAAAIGNVNITYITGESESGKTSLARLISGTSAPGHDVTPINEAAHYVLDTSTAGMYQTFDNSSLAMVYDEAEVSHNHNTKHDENTEELQRLLMVVPQGGSTIVRGGQTADKRVIYNLRMPIVMAGINLPTNRTLLSRIVIIYTRKEVGRRAISDYISSYFTNQELEYLRRDITIGLLPHVPKLVAERYKLKQELVASQAGNKVSDRYIENMLTPIMIYKVLGRDYKKLFADIYNANRERVEIIHGSSESSDLIDACLYLEKIKVTNQDGSHIFTSARNLILQGEINLLNNSECGIYYYAPKNWIILFWRQIKYTILPREFYGKQTESALKEIVSKVKFVTHDIAMVDHNSIKKTLGLPELRSPVFYSVVDAEYLGTNTEDTVDPNYLRPHGQQIEIDITEEDLDCSNDPVIESSKKPENENSEDILDDKNDFVV